MTYNYTIRDWTAASMILALDEADPIHRAHIGEIWTLCRNGCTYSNEDGDKLGAAWAALHNYPRPVPDHMAVWVARWDKCPAHIADARRWALATA
jgi:hypothetical protein